jgi:uncharacterized protein with HEPN domain
MNENDQIRVKHMLDAARAAQTFAQGKNRQLLDSDLQLVFALVKAIEIIGEAGSKLSKETRDAHPQISWSQIIGMRNILVHDYFDIDLDRLWKTIQESIPFLITQLEKIILP